MRRRGFLQGGAMALAPLALGSPGRDRDEGYGPLGSVPLDAAKAVAVSDDGATAYVAGGSGFAVIDLTDPAEPALVATERELLADRADGPVVSVDLSVDDDRLLVGGPKFAVPSSIWALILFDVSDPTSPARLRVRETDHANHNVTLVDETAYATGTGLEAGPLVVLDVSGDALEELARWSPLDADPAWAEVGKLLRSCHDVTVRDDRAYAPHLEAGTWILDVSDPTQPRALGQVGPDPEAVAAAEADSPEVALTELPGNAHSAVPTADGTVLAVAHEAWDHLQTREVRGPGGVVLWDVRDPTAPTELARLPAPQPRDPTKAGAWTTAHNVDVVGDRLYSGWFQGGVQLHDLTDPGSPERLAWWREPAETAFWTARSAEAGEFFVAPSTGRNGTRRALYTFPDRPGKQVDPPSLTPSPTPTPSAPPTAGASPSPEPTPPAETAPVTTTDTAVRQVDGFGFVGALAGLGVAGWLARRRSD